MPTLNWIGRKAVENHHKDVPFHLLRADPARSIGDANSGNLLVEGDNLLALKALLPYYAGQVKCIYIDPPYNTGNENWVYNDAVNSPEMRDWLGKVEARYIGDLQRQMALIADDRWSAGELLYWLERNIEHQDLEPDDFARFAQRMVRHLTDARGLSLEFLVHNKSRLRAAAMDRINQFRREAHLCNFQTLLLPLARTPIVVSNDVRHVFDPTRLPPYQSLYQGAYQFKKHYYAHAGDLQSSGEEFECAQFLDTLDAVKFWVRNPVKTPLGFVCALKDGRYLVVEYKNATDWSNDENTEKRDLGELWEARSNGQCLFIMPKGKDFDAIRAKVV